MHIRELVTAIAIFSIVALETVVLVPSLVIQLILILIFTGTLISYFSKSPLLLNVFTSAYCIFGASGRFKLSGWGSFCPNNHHTDY